MKEIPVRMIQFAKPQDGPGISVASSCTAVHHDGRQTNHYIWFVPELRHFRVEFKQGSDPKRVGYIHEGRVTTWEPLPEADKAEPERPEKGKRAG